MGIKIRHRIKLILDLKNPLFANAIIASIFISIAGFFIITGYAPVHDAISWHGIFHYFYNSVEKGILPYWNPYSQTGTPFYVYYQSFGLLEPTNFLFVFIQKITGCSTFTTYILHYIFYFYIFIAGAYYVLRITTKNNVISLLFSLILFLACFPMFMRQNGALNSFFLVPFIIYFMLLFFEESDNKKKGFYFFIASYLFALTLNVYIPSGVMFSVALFVVFAFIFKIAKIDETIGFIKSRKGLISIGISAITAILISFPVFALYYDFHNDTEIFPSVRIFQKNGNNIAKLYVSDVRENFFSEEFTNNLKVSSNLWNLFGLLYEPLLHINGEESLNFYPGKFKPPHTVEGLCKAIDSDNYGIPLHTDDNTIERLNEILETADFYDTIIKKNRVLSFSASIKILEHKTAAYRNKKFSELNSEEQGNIKRLNYLLLEELYPGKTPGKRSTEEVPSEIFLYVGILPILCGVIAIRKRNQYAYVFSAIAFLTLILMSNFKRIRVSPPNLLQRIIADSIPFLKTAEVLQNFGALFIFCLIIIGAIGFASMSTKSENKFVYNVSAIIVFFKGLILIALIWLFVKYRVSFSDISDMLYGKFYLLYKRIFTNFSWEAIKYAPDNRILTMLGVMAVTASAIIVFNKLLLNKLTDKKDSGIIRKICVIILFVDLLIFQLFHVTHFMIPDIGIYEKVIDNKYHRSLKQENLLKVEQGNGFNNYREPFSYPALALKYPSSFKTMWGHEVYTAQKIAFPMIVKAFLSTKFGHLNEFSPRWDHFYMTKYYYDYVANIAFPKHLVTSSIISPILNFYPDGNAIFADNKYEIIQKINESGLDELGKYIFIEKNKDAEWTSPTVSDFFDSKKYLDYSEKEFLDFEKGSERKYSGNKYSNYDVKYYDINRLSLSIEAPVNGYFYFGDGYSKDWKALVDNMEKEIYKTNINFKSVHVPKGKHKIDFIYDPVLFRYSLYAYFAGNLMALGILLLYSVRMSGKGVRA